MQKEKTNLLFSLIKIILLEQNKLIAKVSILVTKHIEKVQKIFMFKTNN